MITLRFVSSPSNMGRAFRFKTLAGAVRKARKLVGHHPWLDPDGYAVQRNSGNCLFFQGATYTDLFGQEPPATSPWWSNAALAPKRGSATGRKIPKTASWSTASTVTAPTCE